MTQSEFARLLNIYPSTVSAWKERGYLVIDDNGINAEASRARLVEKRGSDKPLTNSQRRRLSQWSRGPQCQSKAAWQSFRKLHGGDE